MPELPEVQTIVEKLKENAVDRTIEEVIIENPKIIACPDEKTFQENLQGKTIKNVNRRGKFIILDLDESMNLVAHMRMTGRLYVVSENTELEKHTHLIINLDDKKSLRFVDPRRFGRFWLLNSDKVEEVTGIDKLGMEPTDPNLTPDYLKENLGNRKKAIKTLLIDQDTVTGIGNIYADEILHLAGIYPARKGNELTDEEFNKLSRAIPEIINLNINECLRNADDQLKSLLDYRSSKTIRTYNHKDQPCPDCGTPLVKTKVNGRSTCYCPKCQPE